MTSGLAAAEQIADTTAADGRMLSIGTDIGAVVPAAVALGVI